MLKSLQAIESYREGEKLPAEAFPWLKYIVQAEQAIVNLERVDSLRELDEQNPVLDYVERSLRLLDSLPLSYWIKELAEETLVWSETAKGGTSRQRHCGSWRALIVSYIISVRRSCTHGMPEEIRQQSISRKRASSRRQG